MNAELLHQKKDMTPQKNTCLRIFGRLLGADKPLEQTPWAKAVENFRQTRDGTAYINALKDKLTLMNEDKHRNGINSAINSAVKLAKELNQSLTAAEIYAHTMSLRHHHTASNMEKLAALVDMVSLYGQALEESRRSGATTEIETKLTGTRLEVKKEYGNLMLEINESGEINEKMQKFVELSELIGRYSPSWSHETLEDARGKLNQWYSDLFSNQNGNGHSNSNPDRDNRALQTHDYWYMLLSNRIDAFNWHWQPHESA